MRANLEYLRALQQARQQTRDYRLRWTPDTSVVAACSAVGCESWLYGWDTLVEESTDLGQRQAEYIRQHSGRTFRELSTPDGMTVFRFEPKQRCFAEHRTRGARALVTQGRQLIREHTSLADIAEDYTEHTGRLADEIERG